MAQFKVTFQNRRTGKKTEMVIEALNTTEARENGSFFANSYGQPIDAKPLPAK